MSNGPKNLGPHSAENELEARVRSALAPLKTLDLSPSIGLKTRVMAHLDERRQPKFRFGFWPVFSTSGGALMALFVAWFYLLSSSTFQGVEGQELILRYHDKSLKNQVGSVDVVLPDGVQFHSKRHPHITELRRLNVSGDRVRKLGYLPIIIKSSESGKKWIHFIFRDASGKIVKETKVPIRFKHSSQKARLEGRIKVPV